MAPPLAAAASRRRAGEPPPTPGEARPVGDREARIRRILGGAARWFSVDWSSCGPVAAASTASRGKAKGS
ncbi:hypothetical protein EJB05_48240, partial [Eragrostis curvula]